MLLCRYVGMGIGRQFIASSYVRRASVIARLTREFNELPPLPTDWASFQVSTRLWLSRHGGAGLRALAPVMSY